MDLSAQAVGAMKAAAEDSLPTDPLPGHKRRPWVAAVANLFLPPTGHFYAGAAMRGSVMAAATLLAGFAVGLLILVLPGLPALLGFAVVVGGTKLALVIDAARVAHQRRQAYVLRPYNRWYAYGAVIVVSSVVGFGLTQLLRTQLQAFRVPSAAMEPALQIGDYFYVDKARYRKKPPGRGDIAVFPFPQDPSKAFVKRVIGLPGETLEIRSQQVFINEQAIQEPYVKHLDARLQPREMGPRDEFGPFTLGPDQYFMMGDNRANSNDSRYWGPVEGKSITGHALVLYGSWDAARFAVRWDRIGTRVR